MYLKDSMDKKENQYSFHMPSHKENYHFFNKDILSYDLTEYDNFDNLANPQTVIKNSINRIERIFKSEKSFILVNGSTVGILASLFYLNSIGGTILAYRNSHKSFFNGVTLTGQKVSFYTPIINENGFIFNLDYEKIEKSFQNDINIKSFFITSPTYEGVTFNLKKLSTLCKNYGVLLVVDEAHGAHFPLSDKFPESAIKYADIVINSLHKTLPALTQTALLHCKQKHTKGLNTYINMLQTSSPSYIFMYSIDKLMQDIECKNLNFNNYIENIDDLLLNISNLKNIKLLDMPNRDKTRITLYSKRVTGEYINNYLKMNNIFSEMYIDNYIVLITSVCDTKNDYKYLYEILCKLDENISITNKNIDKAKKTVYNYIETLNNEIVYTLKECDILPSINCNLYNSENQIAKDFIIPYPPGIPILLSGERITKSTINIIATLLSQNIEIIGISDDNIRVIQNI